MVTVLEKWPTLYSAHIMYVMPGPLSVVSYTIIYIHVVYTNNIYLRFSFFRPDSVSYDDHVSVCTFFFYI